MTKNQKRKNISLSMLIIEIVFLIGLALCKLFFGWEYDTWQYLIAPFWIALFMVTYRNFSQAVKEDEKYGQIEK